MMPMHADSLIETEVAGPAPAGRDRPAYELRHQIGFMLRLAFQHHTAIFTSRMIGNLTQPQYATLWTLRDVGLCSQNSLGRLVALDSATIRGVVVRLEQRGYIQVLPDPNDKRRLVLSVTASGRALLVDAEAVAASISEATLSELNGEERRHLLHLLDKLYAPSSIAAASSAGPAVTKRRLKAGHKGDGHDGG